MKFLLNVLLYITQWLHIKMGGTVEVARDRIILRSPKGRHWIATEKRVEAQLVDREKERKL